MKFITTSWDDGHVLDFRLAELLHKHGLAATFYIPKSNPERPVIGKAQIRSLAEHFEIGGHTLSHFRLDVCDKRLINHEVAGSYEWLAGLLGYAPSSFCFPMGKYNAASIDAVFNCGYKVARTTELLSVNSRNNQGLMPTTIQVFPHSRLTYIKHLLKRKRFPDLAGLLQFRSMDLEALVFHFLNSMPDHGSLHLWGHSWEIDQYNLWNKLEDLFKMLAYNKTFCYACNKDLPILKRPN